jgi:hypothetical protein
MLLSIQVVLVVLVKEMGIQAGAKHRRRRQVKPVEASSDLVDDKHKLVPYHMETTPEKMCSITELLYTSRTVLSDEMEITLCPLGPVCSKISRTMFPVPDTPVTAPPATPRSS